MQIANPGTDAVGWEDQTYTTIPGTVCVFDLPDACGLELLSWPVLGWRWPLPEDWGGMQPADVTDPVIVESLPAGKPATVAGRRAPLRDVAETVDEPASTPEPEPEDTPEPEPADVEPETTPEPETVDDEAGSVPEQLVALAHSAGTEGLSTAAAFSACGKPAYTALGRLAADGRLAKVGRGLYRHPDFA